MKLLFVSLGCDKNLVDSEEMLGLLTTNGFEIVDDETEAEAIIVNTCCFINDAKEESVNTILEMAEYRKIRQLQGPDCHRMSGAALQTARSLTRVPEVDAVLGTTSYGDILEAVDEAYWKVKAVSRIFKDIDRLVRRRLGKRVLTTGGHYRDTSRSQKAVTSTVPTASSRSSAADYRSVPMERLLEQAQEMAEQGVKELILVAQETTLYGTDIYGKKVPSRSLKRSYAGSRGIRWIRVLYCYPEEIYDELIQTMKEEKKICHYLDLPIQHASDRILKRMGQKNNQKQS